MIDYNSKHTGDEIESLLDAIDSKQDNIIDLEAIREGASLGATALQSIPDVYVTEADLEGKDFATTADLIGKVDKQTGKGLSTEDFTTALKNKLEQLSNYDDRAINAAIDTLRNEFDMLVSGDATTAIDTFNEIIAFLNGVSESDNLASIIASIEQQIAAKQDKIEGLESINEKLELINSIIDEDGYLYSNGEKVDMRFTRSLLPVGTSIPASSNLNTIQYLKIGKYYCSLNDDAENITNCPVTVAFSMEVFNPLGTNVDDETTRNYTYRLRVITQYDSGTQYMQFCKTSGTAGSWTYGDWYAAPRTKATLNSDKKGSKLTLGSGTQGVYVSSTGVLTKMAHTLGKSVPSNAVFTDTNTKVTAVENHYVPAEDASSQLDAEEEYVVIGLKRDAAGHIVGIVTAPAPTADNLTGRLEATPEMFTYRASAGNTSIKDSSAVIRRIKGNSVIWNQIIANGDFQNSSSWGVNDSTGTTLSIANNKATITSKYSGTSVDVVAIKQTIPQSIKGHKYFVTLDFICDKSELKPHFEWYKAFSGYTSNMTKSGNTYRGIFTASDNGATGFYLKPQGSKAVGDTWDWSNVMMVDLTKMFGSGNEPATVEDFVELYPDSYYDTNSQGKLISVTTEAIKTVGFNQWDGSYINGYVDQTTGAFINDADYQRTNFIKVLPNTDYYVNSETYGLEWGAWYDSDYHYIEGIDGFNQVIKSPATAKYVVLVVSSMGDDENISTFCLNLSHTAYRNGEYEPYKEVIHDLAIAKVTGGEPLRKVGNVYDEINDTHYIKRIGAREYEFEDTGDTSVLTDGETTIYVLDNEVATALDEPIDFSYYVEDFGTEEAISSVPSAPFSADIVYQFNAVDRIRQNDANITRLYKKLVDFIQSKKRFEPLGVMEDGAVEIAPITPNCIYYHNTPYDIGSITIGDFEMRDAVDEYTIYFRSGREGTMLSISDTVYWANGVIPEIEPETEYELSIVRYNNGGSYITKAVLTKFATV